MTAYYVPRSPSLAAEVAARKAARRRVIEKAHRLEQDSYKAMMRRKRRLQASSNLV
jgi:hypothetical protein